MSTDEPQAPEGFSPVTANDDDDDDSTELNLDAGETFTGLVLQIQEGENEHGPWWRLTLMPDDAEESKTYFAKDEVKLGIKDGRVKEGKRVWIARGVTEQEIGNDGDTYLPTKCEVAD